MLEYTPKGLLIRRVQYRLRLLRNSVIDPTGPKEARTLAGINVAGLTLRWSAQRQNESESRSA